MAQIQPSPRAAHAARVLLPAAFVLLTGLMVGIAEISGEREIIFPEAAAIALGALVAPRLPWRTSKGAVFLLIGVCAVLGVAIVRFLPLPLAWQLSLAYLAGQLVFLFSRTTFAPIISAVVLPVLLQTSSLVYIAAALALTALILLTRAISERAGLRRREPFAPLPRPSARDIADMVLRAAFAALLCGLAVWSRYRFLVCPPLWVAFTEFTRRGNRAMRTPVRTVAFLALCAAFGAACRLALCVWLNLPLTLAALAAGAAVLALALWQKTFLPPAAAVALLAMLIPAEALPSYPLQIVCGAAVYVLLSLLFFRRRAVKTPQQRFSAHL